MGDERILLLPEDPSASAPRTGLWQDCAVIITDTCSRLRSGVAGVAGLAVAARETGVARSTYMDAPQYHPGGIVDEMLLLQTC